MNVQVHSLTGRDARRPGRERLQRERAGVTLSQTWSPSTSTGATSPPNRSLDRSLSNTATSTPAATKNTSTPTRASVTFAEGNACANRFTCM